MRFFLSVAFLFVSFCAHAKPIPVEDFAKAPQYYNVIISPTGEYLAVDMLATNGSHTIAILKTSDMSVVSQIPPSKTEMPFNPVWVNNDRLVVQVAKKEGTLLELSSNGELYAINANGSKKEMLITSQAWTARGSVKSGGNDLDGYAEVINVLRKDIEHVLIAFYPSGAERPMTKPKVYRLNVNNGKISNGVIAASKGAHFITNDNGDIAYSIGIDAQKDTHYLVHAYEKNEWVPKNSFAAANKKILGIVTIQGKNEVLVEVTSSTETNKIYKLDLVTNKKTILFHNKEVDPTSLERDIETGELVAVRIDTPYPDVAIINPKHPYGYWYPALQKVFKGKRVIITSATKDYSLLTVAVDADNEASQFYIFNTKTKKLAFLLNAKSWMKKEQLASTQGFQVITGDNVTLNGYLTLPKGKSKNVPMVVMPHSGPQGRRDFWGYNDDVQFLASRGYAVLQVNYRGSGGYGHGFEQSGHKKWGTEIQNDIVDATQWAINAKIADPKRICIYGSAFGGYSALMSAMLEPEMYQCAIGYAGVYNLELLLGAGDGQVLGLWKNDLKEAIGNDKEQLAEYSPINHIDELKVPVLLIHGKDDKQADVKHCYQMEKALKKANHPFEAMLVNKEGHGFYDEKNRKALYKRMEKFLAKNIGE